MFRVIGGAVVYGLALYGVVKIFERQKVAVVIQPNANHRDKGASEGAGIGEGEGDPNGQPAVGEMPTGASTPDTV
jgi:hypothetical protein